MRGKLYGQYRNSKALAVQIRDREQQLFTLADILAFTDKLIDTEIANKIKRAIEMTQVAQIFEEEKQQAVQICEEEKRQALAQIEEEQRQTLAQIEEEQRQTLAQAVKDTSRQVVIRLLKKDYPAEEIIKVVPDHCLNEVEALKAEILKVEKKN